KKTAERLVLELKDKLLKRGSYDLNSASSSIGDDIEALLALGYSLQEAREALNQVDPTISDVSSRIKEALKRMSN
ncbi:MAG: Holliday junction branch migration protein RuvA, partial [Patescibacteria group bacterium]